jgi:hypothetical protein
MGPAAIIHGKIAAIIHEDENDRCWQVAMHGTDRPGLLFIAKVELSAASQIAAGALRAADAGTAAAAAWQALS